MQWGGRKARPGLPRAGLRTPERSELHEKATLQHTPVSSYSPIFVNKPFASKVARLKCHLIASLGRCRKTIGAREEEAAAS